MNSKTVYLFDAATGQYAGVYEAQESPLEPRKFLEPDASTSIAPPAPGADQVAVFADGAWSLQPDFRRSSIYSTVDGSRVVVDQIGPLPDDATALQRPSASHDWKGDKWVVSLPRLKAEVWAAIKAKRDLLSDTGGYKVTVDGVDRWFHSDPKSKGQQMGLVLASAAAAGVPPWKTMDGTKVAMSQALASQIFQAAMAMEGAIFQAAETHRAAMEASADPSAYDFSGGWPAVFPG